MTMLQLRVCRRSELSLAVTFLLGASACAAPMTSLPPPRPLGQGLEAVSVTNLEESGQPVGEPQGDLTLRDALAAALRQSPRLESFAWQLRADEARTLQAGLLPNPTLVIEAENFAGSDDFDAYDAAETTVFLGQLVELGGKRAKRRRIAMLERELSGWEYESARLDVLTQTTQRFVAVLAAQERLQLANDLHRVASDFLGATRARVRAGAASSVEEARSKVELATLEVALARRAAALEVAKRQLASSWGTTSPEFSGVEGELFALRELPGLERIVAELAQNPDMARWATEKARRDAAVELARARAIPDVTAGLGVRRFEESDAAALVFALEVPLPLFDRNQGATAAALAEVSRTRALTRARQLELSRLLVAAHAEASSSYEQASSLRDTVLPQAESSFESTRDGYRRGFFRYVDVLDAQRTLFEARGEYVDALKRYHTATAELERLVGASIENLMERQG